MPRGVKRQKEEIKAQESSPEKKRREDNATRFEEMKRVAEENRRRVRDEYLKEQENQVINDNGASSRPSRRESFSGPIVDASRPTSSGRRRSVGATADVRRPLSANSKTSKQEKKPDKSPSNPPSSPSITSSQRAESKKKASALKEVSKLVKNTPESQNILRIEDDSCGQLYPSIALSDSVNAIGHLCGAFVSFKNGQELASLGFLSVWLAAIVGVLRFGVSEKLFKKPNSDLADLAAFVGYPMIGMSFVAQHYPSVNVNSMFIAFVLVAWETLTRSFPEKNRDTAKLATNIAFFVVPVATSCFDAEDFMTLGGLLAFVLAGIAITPHHENRIFGMRCVDWFHYIIGATAVVFARGLGRV